MGFEERYIGSQFVIDLTMPEELKRVFFARFYGRGAACDGKDGDPAKVWESLSYKKQNIKLVAPHQVHGTRIIPSSEEYSLPLREDADGVFIRGGSACFGSLRFADCMPVVIAGAEPESWLLLLHSGFAGTVKNIAARGLEYVRSELCGISADSAWAWTGPGICGRCYSRRRYGDESTSRAMKIFSSENYRAEDELVFFDIRGQITGQLSECGLKRERIFSYDKCTFCGGAPLCSYRGGDANDRIFLLAGDATKE